MDAAQLWLELKDFCGDPGCPLRGKGRMPLESSSSSLPQSLPSALPSVPDSITNSSPPPVSYITTQEIKCILHWFATWSDPQQERFLQNMVAKAVPGKLQPLLVSLEQLSASGTNRPSYLFGIGGFECQLPLWDQWFRGWAEQGCNEFVRQLEVSEPHFVAVLPSSGCYGWKGLITQIERRCHSEWSQGYDSAVKTVQMCHLKIWGGIQ